MLLGLSTTYAFFSWHPSSKYDNKINSKTSKQFYHSLRSKMIVLPLGVFCLKMIVRDQMFIDFVDVEKFAK